jgi:hypothetical protein
MGALSIKILYSFFLILGKSYDETNIINLIEHLKLVRYGNRITRKNSGSFLSFLSLLENIFDKHAKLTVFFPNDTSIMG